MMKKKEIIEQGNKEAYDLLVPIILSDVEESLRESYDYYEFLDFSNEVYDHMMDELTTDEKSVVVYEILKPAIDEIIKKIETVLKKKEEGPSGSEFYFPS